MRGGQRGSPCRNETPRRQHRGPRSYRHQRWLEQRRCGVAAARRCYGGGRRPCLCSRRGRGDGELRQHRSQAAGWCEAPPARVHAPTKGVWPDLHTEAAHAWAGISVVDVASPEALTSTLSLQLPRTQKASVKGGLCEAANDDAESREGGNTHMHWIVLNPHAPTRTATLGERIETGATRAPVK
jgi:hypothetical protein